MTTLKGKMRGYAAGIIAAASYGTIPLFTLPLYMAGINADSALLFRYLIAILILGVMMRIKGLDFRLRRHDLILLLTGGVLMSLSSLTLFASYNHMSAGIASTLLFVYPVMVALIMSTLYKEKINFLIISCLICAVAGIALLCRTPASGQTSVSTLGVILAILSALTYAIYIVGINKTNLDNLPTLKVTFYVLLFGLLLFILRFAAGYPLTFPPGGKWFLWGNIFALALIPTAVSFLCTTIAIQKIGATATAILGAFEPLTALFFGWVVFDEILMPRQWIGVILVITAVMTVINRDRCKHYLRRFYRKHV